MADEFDVVIVGSGVAGSLLAWKLSAEKALGLKIVILEAGRNTPDGKSAGIGFEDRKEFQRVAENALVRDILFSPYTAFKTSPNYPQEPVATRRPFENGVDPERYYDRTDSKFQAPYLRQVGGSTWAFKGNTPRFVPNDFVLQSEYQRGVDWPVGARYDDLEPYYCDAEDELGISGDASEWSDPRYMPFGRSLQKHFGKRSRDFPMPSIAFSYSDEQIINAIGPGATVRVDGQDIPVYVMHGPQARTSKPYSPHPGVFDLRPACEGNSNCVPLCPIGAKYDATVHLKQAIDNGVQLIQGAVVTRLECGPTNPQRIERVIYKKWDSSNPHEPQSVVGKVVVLAAHAIETPRLLLMSGLANASDQVGRNLMDHLQEDVSVLFPEPLYPFRGPQGIATIEVFRDGPFRAKHSAVRITIGNDGARPPTGRSISEVLDSQLKQNVYGSGLQNAVSSVLTRTVRFGMAVEVLPNSENRVTLSDKLDNLALPRPRIKYDIAQYSRDGLQQGFGWIKTIAQRIAPQPGAIEPEHWANKPGSSAHIMGTCRMGDHPRTSVVNTDGRAHDHQNLFIVGSSVFPTSGTANPTLTITALTLKTADAIAKTFKAAPVQIGQAGPRPVAGNRDSTYLLVKGRFKIHYPGQPVGGQPEPDGDTIKFEPGHEADSIPHFKGGVRSIRPGKNESIRFDGADALELHYGQRNRRHQQLALAFEARDVMLKAMGFGQVTFHNEIEHRFRVADVENNPIDGYVLAKGFDRYDRLVGLVYVGKPAFVDDSLVGKWIDVQEAALDQSVNVFLVTESLAYATFYDSMPQHLRQHFRARARAARATGKNLWAQDALAPAGTRLAVENVAVLDDKVIMPKVFRRLVDYFGSQNRAGLGEFDQWIRDPAQDRDDVVWLPNGQKARLHDIYSVDNTGRLALRYLPEDLTFADR